MLDRRSALATARPFACAKLTLGEVRGFTLTQIAGFEDGLAPEIETVTGALPTENDRAAEHEGRVIFRTGPRHFWLVGAEQDNLASRLAGKCVVTPLSHSRTRIALEGSAARNLLAKGIPLDLHPRAFTPGMFAMTGLHHTPVLLHCVAPDRFELYAMRTFALDVWEWLEDAGMEYRHG